MDIEYCAVYARVCYEINLFSFQIPSLFFSFLLYGTYSKYNIYKRRNIFKMEVFYTTVTSIY